MKRDKYAEFRTPTDAEPTNGDLLTRLSDLAQDQRRAEEEVARLETALKTAKTNLSVLAQEEIPALMQEAGMKEFVTRDGLKLKLKEDIRAKIPEKSLDEACEWIEGRGDGGIIKRLFVIKFGRDDEKWARRFEADLKRRKRPLQVDRTKGVHNQTLLAYLRRLRREGVGVPMALFGAYEYTVAEVKLPKDKRTP